jgi:acetolactate synthase-1/2/3 large subunit
MKVSEVVAEILKREGVDVIFGYPRNRVLESAAEIGIRPIIVRQERTGVHMADALSRMTRGERMGVFAMQHGPGAENSWGGVAQAYSESVPVLVLPMGYALSLQNVPDNFNAVKQMGSISKLAESINQPQDTVNIMRRSFTQLRNGRPRPTVVEMPWDILQSEFKGKVDYKPVLRTKFGPDPDAVREAARTLVKAKRPVIYAGQGVHWANAYAELKELAELLAIPVSTSLEGKSCFDEHHPLSLGSGGAAIPKTVRHFLDESDVIFGVGASMSQTSFGVQLPRTKKVIHNTLDEMDINKNIVAQHALLGDAKLTLQAMIDACRDLLKGQTRDPEAVHKEIKSVEKDWMKQWLPLLTSDETPLTPYRVLWDLQHTVDVENTIITHDAGSPRDQLSPFWKTRAPLTYIGWGKTTQLGYGLGLAMGAKLACPDKLCINVWGDAAIGFTGMDFETAVRDKLPILSILLNNEAMAIELDVMPEATKRFRATDISGNYAAFAKAMGGYGERVHKPEDIIPAIKRGIKKTQAGIPVILEFMTSKEKRFSRL